MVNTKRPKVNIRKTHPTFYYLITVFSLGYMGLGLNFFFTTPAFNPYGLPYVLVGAIFLSLGLSKIVVLNFIRVLPWLRLIMALEIGVAAWWSFGTIVTYFRGQTSLQMFALYATLAALEAILMREPVVNPMTMKDDV